MIKKIFLYTFVLLLSTVLLTGCTKKEEEEESKTDSTVEQEEEVEEEKIDSTDLGYLSNPEEFTKTKKSLGQNSEFEYTVASVEGSKGVGYHDFVFKISSNQEDAVIPLFTIEPILDKGVLRVTLKNVVSDTSGITFDKGIVVDTGAITGLFRTVTSLEKTRIYDIGILANNPFKLDQLEIKEGEWVFSVKVAYDTKYTPPTVDYGSTQFSSDAQEIKGMTSSDGARISTYSYSSSGGIFKFVLGVASGASNPIPSVEAKYDDEGMLVVTFPSLQSDKVSTWGSTISLPGGLSVFVNRAGESSVYRFGGISGKKPFKLSATQSPNQVIVEITI